MVPGFVDLQCNGAVGVDLATEPERLWDAVLTRLGPGHAILRTMPFDPSAN